MVDLAALRAPLLIEKGKLARIFSAPGRVNLIGEHTDYNQGFVLPIAIDRRTFVAAATRDDRQVQINFCDLNEKASFPLDAEGATDFRHWVSYVEGVARVLQDELGATLRGVNLAIASEVPIGVGLSSSAALEVSVGAALLTLANIKVELMPLALAAQRAEHLYAGTRCGVMDQLAAVFGRKDHALLIDCRTLEITPIALNFPQHAIVVCNTNVKHQLAYSAYNQRRVECELSVNLLRDRLPNISALRDVTPAQFASCESILPLPLRRRARHVISEIDRTLRAAKSLSAGNAREFGELMVQSQHSLRDDFEVSCPELDTMVEIALSCESVAGARLTGAGFGGCTVNLVALEAVSNFRDFVEHAYQRQTGIVAETYVVRPDPGIYEVTERVNQ